AAAGQRGDAPRRRRRGRADPHRPLRRQPQQPRRPARAPGHARAPGVGAELADAAAGDELSWTSPGGASRGRRRRRAQRGGPRRRLRPTMIERELRIANKLGLHARATAKLVQVLSGFSSNATLMAKGREVNAKSIMGVMLLAAGHGTTVVLRLEGEDEEAAMEAAAALFERKFDEGG